MRLRTPLSRPASSRAERKGLHELRLLRRLPLVLPLMLRLVSNRIEREQLMRLRPLSRPASFRAERKGLHEQAAVAAAAAAEAGVPQDRAETAAVDDDDESCVGSCGTRTSGGRGGDNGSGLSNESRRSFASTEQQPSPDTAHGQVGSPSDSVMTHVTYGTRFVTAQSSSESPASTVSKPCVRLLQPSTPRRRLNLSPRAL
jgi:hypothetical protein